MCWPLSYECFFCCPNNDPPAPHSQCERCKVNADEENIIVKTEKPLLGSVVCRDRVWKKIVEKLFEKSSQHYKNSILSLSMGSLLLNFPYISILLVTFSISARNITLLFFSKSWEMFFFLCSLVEWKANKKKSSNKKAKNYFENSSLEFLILSYSRMSYEHSFDMNLPYTTS